MKKALMVALVAGTLFTHPVYADITWQYNGLYAHAMSVTEIEWGDDGINLITLQDSNGEVFQYADDVDDLMVGDVLTCIMDTNGTENDVTDDIILSAKYERVDLLP